MVNKTFESVRNLYYSLTKNLFLSALAIVACIVGSMVLITMNIYKTYDHSLQENYKISQLVGNIAHYDEILTMSAVMASMTGDPSWIKRYEDHEQGLDQALRKVQELRPGDKDYALLEQINQANIALIDIEKAALQFVREGKLDDARKALFSEEYNNHKSLYDDNLNTYMANINEGPIMKLVMMDITLIAACLILLLIFFAAVFNFLDRSRKKTMILKERAEELSRLKSDFLATMSHEIRTPMNGILGMAELILSTRPSPQIGNYARTIINSGETLLNIINDILDFSKIEAGKMQLDIIETDMLELVDDLAALHNTKARDKGLELVVRYVPGSERFVYADPMRIRQILGNLISNSIKFTDKGHIAVTVEEIAPDHIHEDIRLRFSVLDTGIGMDEETQTRIFEKFAQADTSTTRKYGGTGLGLNISKSLVQMMGGVIGVESKPGQGTIFWFEIPVKRNSDKPQGSSKFSILKDIRVLVVDDLPVIRDILTEQLKEADMQPASAASGAEALRLLRYAASHEEPFQIAIIDYLMPGMNGSELAKIIQSEEALKDTCLVMLTAAGNPMADENFSTSGFSAYISKPIQNKVLIEGLGIIWNQFRSGESGERTLLRLENRHYRDAMAEEDPVYNLQGKKILLVEDNLVNQIFIKEILESMQCEHTVMSNGRDAIDDLTVRDYDLIIMDCMMPIMDGYEATRMIRDMQKKGELKADLPVIALTANAMKGDRERCEEAGMDDYISKPVRKKALQEMLLKWLYYHGKNAAEDQTSFTIIRNEESPKPPAHLSVLDTEYVENARNVLKADYPAMVHIFIQNCHERLQEIRDGLEKHDALSIVRPAHTLKSTSRQMGAMQMGETAMRIEMASKELSQNAGAAMNFKPIEADMALIETQLQEVEGALAKIAA